MIGAVEQLQRDCVTVQELNTSQLEGTRGRWNLDGRNGEGLGIFNLMRSDAEERGRRSLQFKKKKDTNMAVLSRKRTKSRNQSL